MPSDPMIASLNAYVLSLVVHSRRARSARHRFKLLRVLDISKTLCPCLCVSVTPLPLDSSEDEGKQRRERHGAGRRGGRGRLRGAGRVGAVLVVTGCVDLTTCAGDARLARDGLILGAGHRSAAIVRRGEVGADRGGAAIVRRGGG